VSNESETAAILGAVTLAVVTLGLLLRWAMEMLSRS